MSLNWSRIELAEVFAQTSVIKDGDKCVCAINCRIPYHKGFKKHNPFVWQYFK